MRVYFTLCETEDFYFEAKKIKGKFLSHTLTCTSNTYGPFRLSLFLLKLKTEIENTIAK